MRIEEGIKLDFDDVLIRPKRSDAPSRKSVDLIRYFRPIHSGLNLECLPIVASNLYSTGTFEMAKALRAQEACCALHKFYSEEDLLKFYSEVTRIPDGEFEYHINESQHTFYTLGLSDQEFEKLKKIYTELTPSNFNYLICLDVANGYTKHFVERVRAIRKLIPSCILMAGNVATPEMVQELILEGADIVKVGIGPGQFCTTRLVAGIGYPQLSAIIECADAAHGLGGLICADGGCKTSADVVKAFGAGADLVMLGGMLAGSLECNGEWNADGSELRVFGMSSKEAQEQLYKEVKTYCAPEGLCTSVQNKGPVSKIIQDICGGLRSACAYVGADSLRDFSKCTTFIRVNRIK
jgi:GMP reductase